MNVITLSLSTAIVLTIAAVGCAADPEEAATESTTAAVTPSESLTPQISTAEGTTGNGVICSDEKCICKIGADNPVDSCNGMTQICNAMGGAVDCGPNPQPGTWCSCTWVLAEQGSGSGSTSVSPLRGIVMAPPATLDK